MNVWKSALDLVFPRCCPGCGTFTASDGLWCDECLKKVMDPHMIQGNDHPHLAACYTATRYTGDVRTLIIDLKYNKKPYLAKAFTPILENFPWWERLAEIELAVPIPLSDARKKDRGYNQTDLIFEEFLRNRGVPYDADCLVRIRNTPKQSLLSKEDREKNMKRAFHINRGKDVKGKTILLLDDIYTTGLTLSSAADELHRAGAAKIIGLTVSSGAI